MVGTKWSMRKVRCWISSANCSFALFTIPSTATISSNSSFFTIDNSSSETAFSAERFSSLYALGSNRRAKLISIVRKKELSIARRRIRTSRIESKKIFWSWLLLALSASSNMASSIRSNNSRKCSCNCWRALSRNACMAAGKRANTMGWLTGVGRSVTSWTTLLVSDFICSLMVNYHWKKTCIKGV